MIDPHLSTTLETHHIADYSTLSKDVMVVVIMMVMVMMHSTTIRVLLSTAVDEHVII